MDGSIGGLGIAVGYVRGGAYAGGGLALTSKKKVPDCAGVLEGP